MQRMGTMMKRIYNYLRRLNPILHELVAMILIYGVLVWIIGIWFVRDKVLFSTGLLTGIVLAEFLSINIARSILNVTMVQTKKDQVVVSLKAVLRYLVVVIVTVVMCYFKLGNIIPWFIGVMGLKVCALAQPFIHRLFFEKKQNEEKLT